MIRQSLFWAVGLAFATSGMAAEFTFEKMPDRHVGGSETHTVAIGDVNGDGLGDVVLATMSSANDDYANRVFVYFQQSDGSLAQPVTYKYDESSNSVDLALGDLNNDGIKDIVVGAMGKMVLMVANGSGGFTSSSIATGIGSDGTTNVAVLDINADGKLDVIAQHWGEGSASLFLGDGRGDISPMSRLPTGARGYSGDLKVGDVTGDGRADLVLAAGGEHFYVHPHDGVAGFGPAITYSSPGELPPDAIAIGDFDGDGRNDIAINTPSNNPRAAIWIYPGQVAAGLGEPRQLSTYDIPWALEAADLDGDGREDLVVGHSGWSSLGRYMQGSAGLGEEILTSATFTWAGLAAGDFNDDGCTDVAIADSSAGLVTLQGRNCIRLPATSDFNGDGRSDVLWRHFASGANVVWLGADADQRLPANRVTDLAWQVVGTGDFNGDGKSDLAWRNARTGAGSIWASANPATSLRMTTVTDLGWTVVGTGDFDGDGHDDLLWRHQTTGANAIWRAGAYSARQNLTGVTNLDWKVVATDDFNGDSRDDILWRNSVTGVNAIWQSGNYRRQQSVSTVPDPNWRVAGTGDFNTDGLADVIWHNASNGKNGLWYSARSQDVGTVRTVGPDWQVAAVGDYDGNGKPEILWRNQRTGENRLWRSTNIIVERNVVNAPDTQWRVMP